VEQRRRLLHPQADSPGPHWVHGIVMSSREGSFAGLGGQAGQDAIQPAGLARTGSGRLQNFKAQGVALDLGSSHGTDQGLTRDLGQATPRVGEQEVAG